MRLHGAVAVVTGGARGIGRQIVRKLQQRGAHCVVVDIDERLAEEVAHEVDGLAYALDVTGTDAVAAFADWVTGNVGPVDVLVNNAGIMPLGRHLDEAPSLTEKIFAVNVLGPAALTKTLVPQMVARGRGHVVNVASSAGVTALPGGVSYSASKSASMVMSEGLRRELKGTGVGVTAVMPGVVTTELSAGVTSRGIRKVTPEEVADRVVTAIAHGRPEVWIPRRLRAMPALLPLLPSRAREGLLQGLGGDTAFAAADPAARAAYEARVRERAGGSA